MIPRMNTDQFNAGFGNRTKPAIITDALGDWRVNERWTPEHITEMVGDRQVEISRTERKMFQHSPTQPIRAEYSSETISFKEAADAISMASGGQLYVMQQSIPEKLPELMDILRIPHWIEVDKPTINLWFGRSTVTPLHYDSANNMFAQVHGSKTFTVFSPDDTFSLYPFPIESGMPHLAHVDVNQPDLVNHPAFTKATPLSVELNTGELLFLPSFWWHQVSSSNLAVSVSFWWHPDVEQILDSSNSDRDFRRLFQHDRLASFETALLVPKGLELMQFAEMLLATNRTWAASVVVLAEFDRRSRALLSEHNLVRNPSLSFEQILNEVSSRCTAISWNGLSPSSARLAESIPSIASRMPAYCDAEIGRDEVTAAIEELRQLSRYYD